MNNQDNTSQQMPTPPVYPTYLTYPDPQATAQLYQLGSQALQAEHRWAQAEIENARLRDRLSNKAFTEDAFSLVGSASGLTYTTDRTGRLIELMNREIIHVEHTFLLPPFPDSEFYEIRLNGSDAPIILSKQEYANDTKLLQVFQETPGLRIRLCRTTKLTAALLRQAIAQRTQIVRVPFYAGWCQEGDNVFTYRTFGNGRTHVTFDWVRGNSLAHTTMPAVAMVAAAERFQQELALDPSQPEHWLLNSIFHISVLASLLLKLGHPFPLSVCFMVEGATSQTWLLSLFKWYGDEPLSLELPPAHFAEGILQRKDEPTLILDGRIGNYSAKNSTFLEDILSSHQIPWTDGRRERYTPLQSLPVILSQVASALTVSADCLTLDLASKMPNSTTAMDDAVKASYLSAFVQYTAVHIDRLRQLLDTSIEVAFDNRNNSNLSEDCVATLGILLAIDSFVREFHTFCGLEEAPLCEACPDAESWLLELLAQTSDKLLDCTSLSSQFIEVARSQLNSGELHPCPIEYSAKPSDKAVFFDDTHLGFTISAMNAICRSLGQSRPLVLRALSEAGLLLGKPVNSGSFLTRISAWNAFGKRETERVYLFSREQFNDLGTPLLFAGEEL